MDMRKKLNSDLIGHGKALGGAVAAFRLPPSAYLTAYPKKGGT
jgi:hypothetical protein